MQSIPIGHSSAGSRYPIIQEIDTIITQNDGAGFVPAKAAHGSEFYLFRTDMNKTRKFACDVVAEIAHGFNDFDRRLKAAINPSRPSRRRYCPERASARLEANTEALRKKPWSCIRYDISWRFPAF
jgi:hypothetical protein